MDFIGEFFRSIGISEIVLQLMLVNAILALSIYLTLHTGMFSLANAGFMAIGAYVGVVITRQLEQPLGVSLIGGMLAAGLVAIPIGLPVLRLRDIYLAIATIGFGEIVRILILNFDQLASDLTQQDVVLTRGALGISAIPVLTQTWHLILFIAVTGYFLMRLNRARFGRAMAAIRQDEEAAANMGIDVVYIKNMVFIMSAMLAGAAGVLNAHLVRTITPDGYGFDRAVDILAFAVFGGTSVWVGPVIGGMVLTALPEVLRFLSQYRGIVNGLLLLLVIVYLPGGIVNPAGWRALFRRRSASAET